MKCATIIFLLSLGSRVQCKGIEQQQDQDLSKELLDEVTKRESERHRVRRSRKVRSLKTGHRNVSSVVYEESTYRLYYVPTVDDINDDQLGKPSDEYEDVVAHQLKNNMGVTIKAIARAGSLMELSLDSTPGVNYLYENKEGATYYGGQNATLGTDPNAFPLKRGLIIHGGVHFGAVCGEHGLYYDLDWDVTIVDDKSDEISIVLSIVDDEATRERAANLTPEHFPWVVKGFSQGQFCRQDQNEPTDFMTKYPVTNMEYSYTITLRKDEDFVRLHQSVRNTSPDVKAAEAWLSLTHPITTESKILARQDLRWRRDTWCFEDKPNMLTWDNHPELDTPLDWPTSCIFYDFPRKQSLFHGVTTNPSEGQGIVYVSPVDGPPEYTKLWSWGSRESFDREVLKGLLHDPAMDVGARTGISLALGRPVGEYYEPWSSGTNFAFFQTSEFEPMTDTSWDIAILPIPNGLTSSDQEELLTAVDERIEERAMQLVDLAAVQVNQI